MTSSLQADTKHAVDLAQGKKEPLQQYGFSLHKTEFHDALPYDWCPPYLDFCLCGEKFTIDHSLSCPTGGFPQFDITS